MQSVSRKDAGFGDTTTYLPGEIENEDATLRSVERFGSPNGISYPEFFALMTRSTKSSQSASNNRGLIGKLVLTNFRLRFIPFAFDADSEFRSSVHRRNSLVGWFDIPLANVHSAYLDAKMKYNLQHARLASSGSKVEDTQLEASDYLLIVTFDGRWHQFRLANAQRRTRLIFLQGFADVLNETVEFERSFPFALRRELAVENEQRDAMDVAFNDGVDHETVLRQLQFADRVKVLNALYASGMAGVENGKRSRSVSPHDSETNHSTPRADSSNVISHVPDCREIISKINRQCSVESSVSTIAWSSPSSLELPRLATILPPPTFNEEQHWLRELRAAECDSAYWRVSHVNSAYEVCPTLPRVLVVPNSLNDADIRTIAAKFPRHRLPVFCFAHMRKPSEAAAAVVCVSEPVQPGAPSVPRSGRTKTTNSAFSRNLLNASERVPRTVPPSNAQRSITRSSEQLEADNDYANGDESALEACARLQRCAEFQKYVGALHAPYQLVHMNGVPTVDQVRETFEKLTARCVTVPISKQAKRDNDWFSTLHATGWLTLIGATLKRASECSALLLRGVSALLVEPVSTDRCLLVAALTEVMLQPRSRTLRGFQATVQRTFVALGHPFRSRGARREASHALPQASQTSVASLWNAGKRNAQQRVRSLLSIASNKNRKSSLSIFGGSKSNAHDDGGSHSSDDPLDTASNLTLASPVFLLFLDCVHQLLKQYPQSFEFTEDYLIALADAYRLGIFDEFAFDCVREAHEVSLFDVDAFRRLRTSTRDSDCESAVTAAWSFSAPMKRNVSVWHWLLQYSVDEQLHFVSPAFLAERVYETLLDQPACNAVLSVCHRAAAIQFWSLYFERHWRPFCFSQAAVRYSRLTALSQLLRFAAQSQPRRVEQLIRSCDAGYSPASCCGLSVALLRELLGSVQVRSMWLDEALQSVEQRAKA